jgi:hypothetical protein
MTAINNGTCPAYAMPIAVNGAGDVVSTGENLHPDWLGMTKREAFAMAAMQGALSSGIPGTHYQPLVCAEQAVQFADALLAELAKGST